MIIIPDKYENHELEVACNHRMALGTDEKKI
jgi:hypothetical protein